MTRNRKETYIHIENFHIEIVYIKREWGVCNSYNLIDSYWRYTSIGCFVIRIDFFPSKFFKSNGSGDVCIYISLLVFKSLYN